MNTANINNDACLVISKKDILYSVLLLLVIGYIGFSVYERWQNNLDTTNMKQQISALQAQNNAKINTAQRISKLQEDYNKQIKINDGQNELLQKQSASIKDLYEINTRLTSIFENKLSVDKPVSVEVKEETNPLLKKGK